MRLAILLAVLPLAACAAWAQQPPAQEAPKMYLNVLDYGAKAGGEADCTAAFRRRSTRRASRAASSRSRADAISSRRIYRFPTT